MSKITTFEVESLDQGFILTDKTRRIAFPDADSLENHLIARFKNEISTFRNSSTNCFRIQLETEQNFPRCATR